VRLQPHALDRFEYQFVQAASALRDVLTDLQPHPLLPEFLDVVGDACYGFLSGKARKIERNLVRICEPSTRPSLVSGARLAEDLRSQALGLAVVLLPHPHGSHFVLGAVRDQPFA
jgi:hypothetical protein